ncbi:hypothetical protein [Streptomyces sp. NPDC001135]
MGELTSGTVDRCHRRLGPGRPHRAEAVRGSRPGELGEAGPPGREALGAPEGGIEAGDEAADGTDTNRR